MKPLSVCALASATIYDFVSPKHMNIVHLVGLIGSLTGLYSIFIVLETVSDEMIIDMWASNP